MNKLVLIAAILTITTATAFAALTSIIITKPTDAEYIHEIYDLTANFSAGESADNASFWYSTSCIGDTWSFIDTVLPTGNSFILAWDTTGINIDACIKVNASNSTPLVTNKTALIHIDNTPPVISNVFNSTPNEHNITITWNTNEDSISSVNYGKTIPLITWQFGLEYEQTHSFTLNSLDENAFYYYNVTSCDKAGNCNTNGTHSFTTESKAPVITNVNASTVSSDYATITWTTQETSNSIVNYGITNLLEINATDPINLTAHLVNLVGLTNGTLYHYNVTSCDAVNNCNTTGPLSFTTLVDTTKPQIGPTSINNPSIIVTNMNSILNISASVGDNTNVSRAWVLFNFIDGTNESLDMTAISGSGSLADPFKYSLIYNITKSGRHNITVYAQDTYGNVNNNDPTNLRVYGYFTLVPNITSPFKNFSYGPPSYVYKITIYNDNNITESYNFSTSITNISGWTVSQSSSNATITNGSNYNLTITVTVPSNASNNTIITTTVNSSISNHSSSKSISFELPSITIGTPPLQYILNNSNQTSMTYYYYNTTNVTWVKIINVTGIGPVTSEVDGNITSTATVDCGLYQNGTRVLIGIMNKTAGTCWLSATAMTPGLYNLTINATSTRLHKGSASIPLMIPSNLAITPAAPSAKKSSTFTLSGNAKYNNASAAPLMTVYASYGGYECNGTTNYNGEFSLPCIAPTTTGTYQVDLTASRGVWNITANAATTTLTVTETQQNQTPTEDIFMTMTLSASSITLDSEKMFTITLLNKRSSTQTYVITASQGDFKRFDAKYSSSITVLSGQSKQTTMTLTPIANAKPGTYTLTISVPQESVSKTVSVTVPEPSYANDSITATRFIEERVDNTSSTVIISLKNNKNETIVAEIIETIPKEFANNTSLITFNPEPTEIINADPIVKWVIALDAGETKEIRYTANGTASNVTFTAPGLKTNEVVTSDDTTVADDSNKIILIIIIVVVTALAAILILYKDEIFKNRGVKFIKPASIIKKKDEPFESPYPGRKLESFGEGSNVDKLGTLPAKPPEPTPEKKKESRAIDFSKLS